MLFRSVEAPGVIGVLLKAGGCGRRSRVRSQAIRHLATVTLRAGLPPAVIRLWTLNGLPGDGAKDAGCKRLGIGLLAVMRVTYIDYAHDVIAHGGNVPLE